MKSCISRSVFLLLLCATTGQGLGQDKQDKQDPADKAKAAQIAQLDKFIVDSFNAHQGTTLCMLGNVPVASVRAMLVARLKVSGAGESATQNEVESALWTVFPCPFSPFRSEIRPATAKDIAGVWLFPQDSQPYRYGPRSAQQPTTADKAVACEAVGYYPGGEIRTATVLGANTPCPFKKAADLATARKRPRVASWKMDSDGKLRVTRTDLKDYLEEWDVYAVDKTFAALTIELKAGDLIAYRRDTDSKVNASIEFRHLQPLK